MNASGVVTLRHEADVDGLLHALSARLQADDDPLDVAWQVATQPQADLWDDEPAATRDAGPPRRREIRLPAALVELIRTAALHDDPARFVRIHTLARRVAHDRRAWFDSLAAERLVLERMAQAVRREIHKMHAFVRFRPIEDEAAHGTRHVAWFEPAHHVVEAAAPFFVRRFAALRWAILTPRGSLAWDGTRLARGPAAQRADAPGPDAGEALWLAYYRSIFNPARVKVAMMRREMPVRFWPHLPEAAQIDALLQDAPQRAHRMASEVDAAQRTRRRAGAVEAPEPGRGLVQLAQRLRRCEDCAFAAHATQAVPGEGAADARVMLVGEQPGDREDLEGRPFAGPAGALLRDAVAALGWPAGQLYLTNAVKHFKYEWRGKRRMHKTASQREAEQCAGWLEQEIALVQPRAIVALGATAARSLLGRPVAVETAAGQWFARADGLPVLVAWHPAALLRAGADPPRIERWCRQLAPVTEFFAAQTSALSYKEGAQSPLESGISRA